MVFSLFGHPSLLGLVQDLGCALFWAITSAGGGPPAVEAHHTEPDSVVGVGPSGQVLSSPAPPSSGGSGSLDGGVAPVSVPDSELSLSVCVGIAGLLPPC